MILSYTVYVSGEANRNHYERVFVSRVHALTSLDWTVHLLRWPRKTCAQ